MYLKNSKILGRSLERLLGDVAYTQAEIREVYERICKIITNDPSSPFYNNPVLLILIKHATMENFLAAFANHLYANAMPFDILIPLTSEVVATPEATLTVYAHIDVFFGSCFTHSICYKRFIEDIVRDKADPRQLIGCSAKLGTLYDGATLTISKVTGVSGGKIVVKVYGTDNAYRNITPSRMYDCIPGCLKKYMLKNTVGLTPPLMKNLNVTPYADVTLTNFGIVTEDGYEFDFARWLMDNFVSIKAGDRLSFITGFVIIKNVYPVGGSVGKGTKILMENGEPAGVEFPEVWTFPNRYIVPARLPPE